jgi:hypothetical protein
MAKSHLARAIELANQLKALDLDAPSPLLTSREWRCAIEFLPRYLPGKAFILAIGLSIGRYQRLKEAWERLEGPRWGSHDITDPTNDR